LRIPTIFLCIVQQELVQSSLLHQARCWWVSMACGGPQ